MKAYKLILSLNNVNKLINDKLLIAMKCIYYKYNKYN